MRIQQFLDHHGVATNPFADEDAQTDQVFKAGCIRATHHPAWDKIYGVPGEPATAVVFGEKGSGKTALRLQMVRHLADHNAEHPEAQVFVVQYDDFNPYLDRFRERRFGRGRRADKMLEQWRLWDHIDAILALATTQLVDRLLDCRGTRHPAARDEALDGRSLSRGQARDVLLLAALYDQSSAEPPCERWTRLQRKLRFPVWRSQLDLGVGCAATAAALVFFLWLGASWFLHWLPYTLAAAGWGWWLWRRATAWWTAIALRRNLRTLNRDAATLRKLLLKFTAGQLVGQPLPRQPRSDDRYELLGRLQDALRAVGFSGTMVLVDRVDEPYLINGSTDLMRLLVWPLLDNKFLKHPGLGTKLLLPIELERVVDRESKEFHERSRLDKQNLIRSLAWTGQSLYDLAVARVRACAAPGKAPTLVEFFEPAIDARRLIDAFAQLRVPRHLFKFVYRLLTAHCNAHTDEQPVWKIGAGTFESVLALYQRDQEAFDRGMGPG